MVHADGYLRTDDMTLATVLAIQGYSPSMTIKNGGGCVWVLPPDEVDEYAEDVVNEYVSGAFRVEPRRFVREMKIVREDMYRFLGIGNKPHGERVRQRPRRSA